MFSTTSTASFFTNPPPPICRSSKIFTVPFSHNHTTLQTHPQYTTNSPLRWINKYLYNLNPIVLYSVYFRLLLHTLLYQSGDLPGVLLYHFSQSSQTNPQCTTNGPLCLINTRNPRIFSNLSENKTQVLIQMENCWLH